MSSVNALSGDGTGVTVGTGVAAGFLGAVDVLPGAAEAPVPVGAGCVGSWAVDDGAGPAAVACGRDPTLADGPEPAQDAKTMVSANSTIATL
ncbi:MAG TPA: hypothetical protein VIL81_00345 [Candidatus Limnocylindrales bacterium]